jgi:long-chain fatty acid transport protein
MTDQDMVKKWKDVVALRFGAQYQITDPLALRLGFVYDQSPVPRDTKGAELPDSNRLNYMIGLGYKVGPWTVDVAFMYIDRLRRHVTNQNFSGQWSGDAWLAGLDISYKF